MLVTKSNMTVLSVLLGLRRSVVDDGRGGGNVTSCQMSGKEPGVEHVIVDTSENKEGLRVYTRYVRSTTFSQHR